MTKPNRTHINRKSLSLVNHGIGHGQFVNFDSLARRVALTTLGFVVGNCGVGYADTTVAEKPKPFSLAHFDTQQVTSQHIATGIAIPPQAIKNPDGGLAITITPGERIRIPASLPGKTTAWKICVQVDGWWQVLDIQISESPTLLSPSQHDKGRTRIAEREWRPRLDELVTEIRGGQAAARHYEREMFFISNRDEVVVELTNRSQSQSIVITEFYAVPIQKNETLNEGISKPEFTGLGKNATGLIDATGLLDVVGSASNSKNLKLDSSQSDLPPNLQNVLITEYLSTDDSLRLLEASRRLQSNAPDSAAYVQSAIQSWLQYAKERGVQCISVPIVFRRGSLYASDHVFKRPIGNVPHSPDSQLVDETAIDRFPSIDLVEQIYIACHDTGILFCPVIDLSFPIHELEALRTKVVESPYIPGTKPTLSNDWDPQSDQVHAALSELLREIPKRYGQLPGYRGFALNIDPNSAWWIELDPENLNKGLIDNATQSLARFRLPTLTEPKESPKPITSKEFQNWQTERLLRTIAHASKDIGRIYGPTSVHLQDFATQWHYLAIENVIGSTPRNMLNDWWTHGIRPKCYSLLSDGNRERYYLTQNSVLPSPGVLDQLKPVPRSRAINSPDRLRVWQSNAASDQSLCLNANPWEVDIHLQWSKPPGTIYLQDQTIEPNEVKALNGDASKHEHILSLPPSSLLHVGWSNTDSELIGWNNANDRTVENIETLLAAFETALTSLSVPQSEGGLLFNGGFEHAPAAGSQQVAKGWATSLNPNATFRRVHTSNAPQNEILQLNTNGSLQSSWLQTEAFTLERNRLQVSAWIALDSVPAENLLLRSRSAASQPNAISNLTVSVLVWNPTTERFDNMFTQPLSPTRQIEDVWQQWAADLSGPLASLFKEEKSRLIKLHWQLSAQGLIKLDNLNATNDFLQEPERIELRNRLFVAKQSLKESNIEPSIRLLEHSWPRLLRASPSKLHLPTTSSLRRWDDKGREGSPSNRQRISVPPIARLSDLPQDSRAK